MQHLDITFRRDPTNYRPRINKLESTKDREQKSAGSYYYLDDWWLLDRFGSFTSIQLTLCWCTPRHAFMLNFLSGSSLQLLNMQDWKGIFIRKLSSRESFRRVEKWRVGLCVFKKSCLQGAMCSVTSNLLMPLQSSFPPFALITMSVEWIWGWIAFSSPSRHLSYVWNWMGVRRAIDDDDCHKEKPSGTERKSEMNLGNFLLENLKICCGTSLFTK